MLIQRARTIHPCVALSRHAHECTIMLHHETDSTAWLTCSMYRFRRYAVDMSAKGSCRCGGHAAQGQQVSLHSCSQTCT